MDIGKVNLPGFVGVRSGVIRNLTPMGPVTSSVIGSAASPLSGKALWGFPTEPISKESSQPFMKMSDFEEIHITYRPRPCLHGPQRP
jgi:hypothetical protein